MMKAIAVLMLLFTVCSANDHSDDHCMRDCPDPSAGEVEAWICNAKYWRCSYNRWYMEVKAAWDACAMQLGMERLEKPSCPDEEIFACCTGIKMCEDVDNCTICYCKNGRYRDFGKIRSHYRDQMTKYNRLLRMYQKQRAECSTRTTDECDAVTTGEGSTGNNMTQPAMNGTASPMQNMTHLTMGTMMPPSMNATAPPMKNMTHPPMGTMMTPSGNATAPPMMDTPGPAMNDTGTAAAATPAAP